MPKVKRTNSQPARLQEALVLHKYILNLFGCKDLEALSRDLKDPALEGVDDEGTSRLYYALKQHLYDLHISQEKLFEYDQNIMRHTNEINERRPEKIQWKYYQYLALLFTEIYLDRYFADKEKRSLMQIADSFRKIVVVGERMKLRRDDLGIVLMGIYEFLQDESLLDA